MKIFGRLYYDYDAFVTFERRLPHPLTFLRKESSEIVTDLATFINGSEDAVKKSLACVERAPLEKG